MIKEQIVKDLALDGVTEEMINEVPSNFSGDYAVPCFILAKSQGRSPALIAKEFVESYKPCGIIEKVECQGAYINVTIKKNACFDYINQPLEFDTFKGKNACVEFSSVNLAKHPHIGHLCTTIIGACISRLLEKVGYKVVRINYLGDYGTPFGKIIAGIKHWGDEKTIKERGVDELQDLYVRFNQEETEELLDEAREWSKKVEDGDTEAVALYNWIIELSLGEINKIYDDLGIAFDDYTGESYYAKKKDEVINLLKEKNLVFESEGALLVDLSKYDMPDFMVLKSDGTSIYATRDISAAMDRKAKYNHDLSIYVTDTSQNLHFASVFKTLELLGFEWASELVHVGYGRLSTPEGKIASRRGKVAVLKDIFETAEERAYDIVKERNLDRSVAKAIGISAVSFGLLKTERLKDAVFDIDSALCLDGETSAYLQYTNARINSIFAKMGACELDFASEQVEICEQEFDIIKHIDLYKEMIFDSVKDYEPCYIARYVIKLATLFNRFYASCKVVSEDENTTKWRLYLCRKVQEVLVDCMKLLGVKVLEKM